MRKELGAQGQQDVSNGLKALIDRAAKGGPDAAKPKQDSQELVPLKWDGALPTCTEGVVPFGKNKGKPLTDIGLDDQIMLSKTEFLEEVVQEKYQHLEFVLDLLTTEEDDDDAMTARLIDEVSG